MADYVGTTKLEGPDIVVLVLYFVILIFFGLWSSLQNRGSLGGYFLAGRSMHWVLVGASLFASNIGSGHFIGLAGSGAASGIGTAVFELDAIYVLVVLGWLFVPVYVASGVFTMPEYLRLRFGGQRIRVYLALLALLLSIFTKISADLYGGAIFLEQALQWNLYLSIIVLLLLAAVFTIGGGLTAVIWTDFIQTIIMIVGAIYLMVVGFMTVGGYEAVEFKYFRAVPNTTLYSNTTCGYPPDNSYHLFRSADDPNYPWTGVIFGATLSSIWYWCTDQVIVQRALAARNLTHAKAGTILAGYLKFFPMWIIVFPGMISRILFPDQIACVDPDICEDICSQRTGCTNIAYPLLVLELMPVGARGLMMAVMLAALLSSLTSIFNSSSTLFTMDIWILIRKNASDTELMICGRLFVLFMVAVGIAWIPIVQNFSELFHYIQSVTSFLSPPITAIYILAVFWKGTTEAGAFWSLMIGLVIGLIRFGWESAYPNVLCGEEDKTPAIISDIHYLHFGCILFAIVFICCIVISLFTQPLESKYLERLLFWNRFSKTPRADIDAKEKEEKIQRWKDKGKDTTDLENPPPKVEDKDKTSTTESTKENVAWYVTAWRWICGTEEHPELDISPEEMEAMAKAACSLDEEPFWRKFVNVLAATLLVLTTFYWGFFY